MSKIRAGILGATGAVGQRFVSLLDEHPMFDIVYLGASHSSAGYRYGDVVSWHLQEEMPDYARNIKIEEIEKDIIKSYGVELVFSALPSKAAKEAEKSLIESGIKVFSNAAPYRMSPNVPVVVPEVNYGHMDMVKNQESEGFIMTNPNCVAAGLTIPLKPIQERFGIKELFVTTYQAISGAGYPGISSMDIMGNVIPHISNEEEKIEIETKKILGQLDGSEIKLADFNVNATAVRVPVYDGHTQVIYLKPEETPLVEDVIKEWNNYSPLKDFDLPTAPDNPIRFMSRSDRPQPFRDAMAGRGRSKGMIVSVGRCAIKGEEWLRYVNLSHNTIRGAAGGSVLNAEIAVKLGYI